MTTAPQSPIQRSSAQPLPKNVKVLGGASFLNDVASEMIFPLLPQFLLSTLGGNRFYLGLIEGTVDTLSSFVKLWAGGWSDRVRSRKSLVVVGYAIAAVARPLIAVTTAPWQLLGIRMGDRFGKGIRTAPRDALIADSTAPEIRGRAFGFHRGMDHLGAAVGPLLAAAFLWFFPDQFRPLFLLTPMILIGWFVYAVIYAAFGLASAAWEVWILFCGYALFYALTEPAEKTLVANLVGQEFRGLAYGWFNCAIGIATLPASLMFGAVYQRYDALTAFGFGAALALLAALILVGVRAPRSP